MTRRGWRARAAVGALAAVMSVMLVAPAMASASSTLGNPYSDGSAPKIPLSTPVPTAQRWLANALQIRLTQLATLAARVRAAKALSGTDRVGLLAIITSTKTGIGILVTEVASATTIPELRLDATSMVGYRVFAVLTPQVTQVIKTDRTLADRLHLLALVPAVDAAINTERLSHKNVTKVRADYRDLVARLSAASSLLSGQSALLLALTASSYPTASATEFTMAAANNTAAAVDLAFAHNDLSKIAAVLAKASAPLAKHLASTA